MNQNNKTAALRGLYNSRVIITQKVILTVNSQSEVNEFPIKSLVRSENVDIIVMFSVFTFFRRCKCFV